MKLASDHFDPAFHKYEIMRRFFARHFPDDMNAYVRIRIDGDLDVFRWREDEYLWKQKKGMTAKYYNVYFDNEWICGFTDDQNPEQVDVVFLKGIADAKKRGVIWFYPHEKPIEETPVDPLNALKDVDTSTAERKMAKEIVKNLVKTKKTKKGKKRGVETPPTSS